MFNLCNVIVSIIGLSLLTSPMSCNDLDRSDLSGLFVEPVNRLDCSTANPIQLTEHPDRYQDNRDDLRRPGTGGVESYESCGGSYFGSPEVVWVVDIPIDCPVNFYSDRGNFSELDLFLLNSCDPSDVRECLSTPGVPGDLNRTISLEAGKYYVVADANGGDFRSTSVTLRVICFKQITPEIDTIGFRGPLGLSDKKQVRAWPVVRI